MTAEHAQQIANHESPRTTKLYDRTNNAMSLDEIERILIKRLPMNKATRDKIKRNLFPAAHPSIEPWDEFRWHTTKGGECDTDKENSSQALAIDVFGTLSLIESRHRIFNEILRTSGFRSSGQWTVELEWPVPNALLGEPRETQVDAVARSRDFLIFMECKFSESEAGR